jgi:hypothetical protein
MEAAQWGEQANFCKGQFLHGTLQRRSDRQIAELAQQFAGFMVGKVTGLGTFPASRLFGVPHESTYNSPR